MPGAFVLATLPFRKNRGAYKRWHSCADSKACKVCMYVPSAIVGVPIVPMYTYSRSSLSQYVFRFVRYQAIGSLIRLSACKRPSQILLFGEVYVVPVLLCTVSVIFVHPICYLRASFLLRLAHTVYISRHSAQRSGTGFFFPLPTVVLAVSYCPENSSALYGAPRSLWSLGGKTCLVPQPETPVCQQCHALEVDYVAIYLPLLIVRGWKQTLCSVPRAFF